MFNKQKLSFYWQLFWKFRALRLMLLFEYRKNFFFWATVSIVWTIFNFFFFSLLLRVNPMIAGWTESELYVLLATFSIIDAFTWSYFHKTMREYTNAVFEGSFDRFLLRPVDPQILISIHDNSYNHAPRLVMGVGILIWAVQRTGNQPTIWAVLGYCALLLCSLVIIYNIWFSISTLAFYVERLNNINEVLPGLRRVFQVPRGLYQGFSALLFTVVLPLGLVSSIPSEFLLGKWELNWLLYFVVFTILSSILARKFFHYSISRYSGAGS